MRRFLGAVGALGAVGVVEPACVTVCAWFATVIIAVLATEDVLAVKLYASAPDPVPPLFVSMIQVAVVVAVQAQVDVVVT
jgi:hypothetical protein